ncbi:MAG: ASKHA domain-containing protein [Gammaproteobacteria bacterium]|nr:ASKHA domain-containing protein [Gammaproteobacteria bacterium]
MLVAPESPSSASTAADVRVVFTPSGRRGRFAKNTTVLEAARELGVDLDSVCGGRGICGRCQIELSEGSFAKHGIESRHDHLSSFSRIEADYAREQSLPDNRRLGCSSRLLGDAVIDVPPDSQVHRQVVRKRAEVHDMDINPLVRLCFIEVTEPNMHDPSGDLRRVREAIEFEWGLTDLVIDLTVVEDLQTILRLGEWKATVAVFDGHEVIAIWPGFKDRVMGLAVDVGSTTIAAHLCDLASGNVLASSGMMNPQIRFGEDLMSRVSYVMMHPDGVVQMADAVRSAICTLVEQVCLEAEVDAHDILDSTFVGNPVMHHLLLGLSPVELGVAPFALATDESVRLRASELDLSFHPGARAYTLPCIAGHVGADAAAMVLSEAPYLRDEVTLLVDVGTNAEIILGNRSRLLAASSPTGPAFEGAQISCGQRAAPGAIERVRINSETLEPRFKVIGSELWSDEIGFEKSIANIGVTGICGSGIIEAVAEMFLVGLVQTNGVIDGNFASRSSRVVADARTWAYVLHRGDREIRVTQNDIRAIQLAKAALYAGIQLLMEHLGVSGVDRIRLAGAFGAHIDVKYAMVLGLIPDCNLEHVTAAGNAAGTGARIALLDRNARQEIEREVRRIEKIETAIEPRFQEHFVAAMEIPHENAEFGELLKVVNLPKRSVKASVSARRKRRRPHR